MNYIVYTNYFIGTVRRLL